MGQPPALAFKAKTMIKFFKHIRKKLSDDNQFFKYSRYAIGEIVLVVIGILIALQINNWNNNRLNTIEEQRILKAITEELKLSKFLFDRGKNLQENKIIAAKNLLKEIQTRDEKSNDESLENDIEKLTKRWLSGTPTSVYDALIGSGDLKLISSEKLRNELTKLKSDQEFLQLFEEIQFDFEDKQLSPFLNQYINRSAIRIGGNSHPTISDIPLTPYKASYPLLLEKMKFANLLVELIEHTSRVLANYERLGRVIERVDSLANIGINRVENHSNLNVSE